jgi:hypothetical protein
MARFFKLLVVAIFTFVIAACGGEVGVDSNGNIILYWSLDGSGNVYKTDVVTRDTIRGPVVEASSLMYPTGFAVGSYRTVGTFSFYCPTTRPRGCDGPSFVLSTSGLSSVSVTDIYRQSRTYPVGSVGFLTSRYSYTRSSVSLPYHTAPGEIKVFVIEAQVDSSNVVIRIDDIRAYMPDTGETLGTFMPTSLQGCSTMVHLLDCQY